MSTEDFVIVPTVDQLLRRETNVVCTQEGCSKKFAHNGALRMHLIKSHRIVNNSSDMKVLHNGKVGHVQNFRYHCPESLCRYAEGSHRFFTAFNLVKQHYLKVHAEKKFVCSKCTMGFGIEHDLKRHLESCGVLYSCGTCPVKYSTKEALLMHCKRGQHVYPEEYQRQTKSQLEKKQKREAKQAKNQPIVTSVLRPVVLIAVQTPLPPAQQTQLPTLKPKSLKTGEDTDQKGTSIDICQNLMNVKVPNLAKQDVVIQTDIYGVDTLALSSKAGPEGSLYEGRQNTQTSQQLHGNTDKIVKSDVKSLKSPQKRFTLGKRRMSQSGCMNPSSPRRKKAKSTTGMQTSVSFTRKKGVPTVNSTQTTGDFILQTAMKHANIQIQKKTVASQVTPQKCGSVQESEVKSSEMQTFISGFKPQLVDSSSQVYNILAESETMTEMPLSTSTQTLQSYLESQQEKLEEKIIDRAQENIKCDENKSLRKSLSASSETMVQIYNETLDSSVSFVVPASNKMPDKNEHENKTKAVVRERDELPDGEMLTAVKLVKSQIVLHSPNDKDPSSNNENIAVHLMKMQDAGAHQLTEDTLFEENYLAGQSHMTDMEAQTMSFSEFDLLLQSSGIFLNGSNFLQCPSSQISPRAGPDENKDFITQAHSPDLDFLSVGTSTMDMNTQTASDLNLFDTYVPIDSNTQTGGEVDFLDLVMSNMETQTLNDDDLVSLGLLDSNLPSSSMQNMSVGTSDFDVDNSELPSASPTKYSFKNGHIAGSSKETSVSTRFLNNAAMLQTGSESVGENKASAQQTVDQHKTNQTGSMPLTDTHQKETVQMETQTLTSDYSENMGQSLMENQTQVELEDTAFMTINMETQTTFDDLQEFCEMLQ